MCESRSHGGTEAQFIALVKARDRLLAPPRNQRGGTRRGKRSLHDRHQPATPSPSASEPRRSRSPSPASFSAVAN